MRIDGPEDPLVKFVVKRVQYKEVDESNGNAVWYTKDADATAQQRRFSFDSMPNGRYGVEVTAHTRHGVSTPSARVQVLSPDVTAPSMPPALPEMVSRGPGFVAFTWRAAVGDPTDYYLMARRDWDGADPEEAAPPSGGDSLEWSRFKVCRVRARDFVGGRTECRVDGLAPGERIAVWAVASNWMGDDRTGVTVVRAPADSEPPALPFIVERTEATSVTLSWNSSLPLFDEWAVEVVRVVQDDVPVATVAPNLHWYVAKELEPLQDYRFALEVLAPAGVSRGAEQRVRTSTTHHHCYAPRGVLYVSSLEELRGVSVCRKFDGSLHLTGLLVSSESRFLLLVVYCCHCFFFYVFVVVIVGGGGVDLASCLHPCAGVPVGRFTGAAGGAADCYARSRHLGFPAALISRRFAQPPTRWRVASGG